MSTPVVVTAYSVPPLGSMMGLWRRFTRRLPQWTKSGVVSFTPSTRASAGLALGEVGASIAFLMSEVAGFMTAGTCGRS